MLLDIPDVRQGRDYDCGAAAVDAVARFHGLRTRGPAREMRTALGSLANPVQGMSPETVCSVLRGLGMRLSAGTLAVEDLRHFTRTGRPVLCPVLFAPPDQHSGHWVVVRGVERNRIHFHCPLNGPTSERVADWLARWRDTSEAGHAFDNWGIVAQKRGVES